jgi:hypothetical protein
MKIFIRHAVHAGSLDDEHALTETLLSIMLDLLVVELCKTLGCRIDIADSQGVVLECALGDEEVVRDTIRNAVRSVVKRLKTLVTAAREERVRPRLKVKADGNTLGISLVRRSGELRIVEIEAS